VTWYETVYGEDDERQIQLELNENENIDYKQLREIISNKTNCHLIGDWDFNESETNPRNFELYLGKNKRGFNLHNLPETSLIQDVISNYAQLFLNVLNGTTAFVCMHDVNKAKSNEAIE